MKKTAVIFTENRNYYRNAIRDHGSANDCIECGQCESVCPQHLPIIEHLKEVASKFDEDR